MRTKIVDPNKMFQSINAAADISGLSKKFIRAGCKDGSIPHIRVGTDYRVNMPLFLEKLKTDSMKNA